VHPRKAYKLLIPAKNPMNPPIFLNKHKNNPDSSNKSSYTSNEIKKMIGIKQSQQKIQIFQICPSQKYPSLLKR